MSGSVKTLGEFVPSDLVLTEESFNDFLRTVGSKAEIIRTAVNNKCIVALRDVSLTTFKSGDILVREGTGETVDSWKKIDENKRGFGKAYRLRGYQIGNIAYIRWCDPADVTDYDGSIIISRTKSTLVRKYGSAPTCINDGTIVCESYTKDYFNDLSHPAFEDFVPIADDEYNFYYRVFATAENGTVTMSDPMKLVRLTWSRVVATIKEGKATDLFQVGDTLTLTDGNELVVASIDTAQTTAALRTDHPHLVTFLFKYGFGQVPFDSKLNTTADRYYKRTKDTYFLNNKNYYRLDPGSNKFYGVTVVVGNPIPTADAYYEYVPQARAISGNNTWSNSDLRAWANGESIAALANIIPDWITRTGATITPTSYLNTKEPSDGKERLTDYIVPTLCTSRYSPIDGNGTYSTADKFFVPSITEFLGELNNGVAEGTQFQIYAENILSDINYSGMTVDGKSIFTRGNLWTRSATQSDSDTGVLVQSLNETTITHAVANSLYGCVIAFSIG